MLVEIFPFLRWMAPLLRVVAMVGYRGVPAEAVLSCPPLLPICWWTPLLLLHVADVLGCWGVPAEAVRAVDVVAVLPRGRHRVPHGWSSVCTFIFVAILSSFDLHQAEVDGTTVSLRSLRARPSGCASGGRSRAASPYGLQMNIAVVPLGGSRGRLPGRASRGRACALASLHHIWFYYWKSIICQGTSWFPYWWPSLKLLIQLRVL